MRLSNPLPEQTAGLAAPSQSPYLGSSPPPSLFRGRWLLAGQPVNTPNTNGALHHPAAPKLRKRFRWRCPWCGRQPRHPSSNECHEHRGFDHLLALHHRGEL